MPLRFELFRDDEDGWRWSLLDSDDEVLTQSNDPFRTRDEARRGMMEFKDKVAKARVRSTPTGGGGPRRGRRRDRIHARDLIPPQVGGELGNPLGAAG